MKKSILLGLAVLVSSVLFAQVDNRQLVKVGVLLPLSGEMASYGQPVRDGFLMRLEELEREDTHYRYEFIFEDTQGNVKNGTLAARKLIDYDKVDFVLSLWGFTTHPVLPIVQRKQIPMLVMMTWKSSMAKDDMVATIGTLPESQSVLMVEAFKKLGYKRVAIAYVRDFETDYAVPVAKNIFEQAGIEVVATEPLNQSISDVSTVVLKIKQTNPDVVINLTYDSLLYRMEKKLADLMSEVPVTNFESYDGVLDLDLVQGRWYVTVAQASGEFAKRYKTRYGRGVGYGAGFAYDTAGLVVRAFESAAIEGAKPPAKAVANAFHNIDGYEGVVGKLSSDSKGSIDTDPQLMRVVDGSAVPLSLEEL